VGPVTLAAMTKGTPRDRTAEIEAAIHAVVTGEGPVALSAGTSVSRTCLFVHDSSGADDGWTVFTGAVGETAAVGSTLRVGLGSRPTPEHARKAGTAAGALLRGGDVAIDAPNRLVDAIVDGVATGYRGQDRLTLHVPSEAAEAASRGLLAADVARLARLLTSAPANLLTPAAAATWARVIAARAGLGCTVLGPDEVVDQGFGALAAIGGGSPNGPHLVRLDYGAATPDVALVGKGITFDSGGLSLKAPAAQQAMRGDMAGAAAVLAVMAALPRAGCTTVVEAVLPFAENLPGPGAVRPGDVVTAWNGTEIQVLDTDFEGRVVLADALALAASSSPRLLIDLATLTYQAEIALGPEIGAVLARDRDAGASLLAAASRAGEPMWPLPYDERYLNQVKTPSGVRNHPLHDTGRAITAALFLGEFVPRSVPWAHLDMAGPSWSGDASGDGATAFGARTLLELLLNE
jgi:leucyl aminopeptidase